MPLNDARRWQGGWRFGILAIFAGALSGLAQAPWHLPVTYILTIPALLWLAYPRGPLGGLVLGWLAGLGYFCVTLFWIVEPFLVDVARHGWMAPLALALMAGGLALFWAVGFAVARIGRRGGLAGAAMLASGWTLAEFGRTTLFTGFPWALIGYGWEETPYLQTAAFLGPHGLGLLTILLFCLPLALPRRFVGALVMAGILALGWVQLAKRAPDDIAMTDVSLRLVQPNIDQKLKWKAEHAQAFFDRLVDLTRTHDGVDAVIWPEAAVPYIVNERPDLNAAVAAAAGPDTTVLLGALAREPQTGAFRNSLMALAPDGAISVQYDKHHLVPFGEYLPMPWLFDALRLQAIAVHAGRIVAGPQAERLDLPGLPPFQPLVCYEAIFPHEILRASQRPEWLLQITNDAWFGTISGPYQHLTQARFRAVEQGLPLVRVANTGISTVIGPHGRMGAFLGLGEMGVIDSLLPAPIAPTIYAKYGDRLPISLCLCLAALALAFSRPRSPLPQT